MISSDVSVDNSTPVSTTISTKKCQCGCVNLVLIATQNMKLCPDCGNVITWLLTDGQKSLVTSSKDKV